MVKTRLLIAELFNENIPFRLFHEPLKANPTSIFKFYKGRSISHTVSIKSTEEVFINGKSFGVDFYHKDILLYLGLISLEPETLTPATSKPAVYKGKRKAHRIGVDGIDYSQSQLPRPDSV